MSPRPVGIPNVTANNHQTTLQRLVEAVNSMQGIQSSGDRVVRVQDLLDAGVATKDQTGTLGSPSTATGGEAGDADPLVELYADPGVSAFLSRQDHVHPMTGTNVNILYPVEKRHLVMEYAQLVNDRAGLLASAALYGVTTEATDFDTKLNALTAYLDSLLVPVDWDDKSDNTTLI